jgi:hypothetical protein
MVEGLESDYPVGIPHRLKRAQAYEVMGDKAKSTGSLERYPEKLLKSASSGKAPVCVWVNRILNTGIKRSLNFPLIPALKKLFANA